VWGRRSSLTRPSRKCSGKNPSEEDSHILLALKVAEEARRLGVRISTAEIVEATKLLAIYSTLANEMSFEDFVAVFTAAYAKRTGDEEKVRAAIQRALTQGQRGNNSYLTIITRDLERLRLTFGQQIRRSQLKTLLERSVEARHAYARLKLLGLIRQGRRGEYVVSEKTAKRIVLDAIRRYGSLRKALEESIVRGIAKGSTSIVSMLGTEILNYVDPRKTPLDINLKLYRLLKGEKAGRSYLSKVMSDKLRSGELTSRPEELYDVLRKEKAIDRAVLERLVEQEPKLSQKVLRDYGDTELRDVVSSIAKRSPSKAAEALAAAYSLSKKEKLALQHLLEHGLNVEELDIDELEKLSHQLSRVAMASKYLLKSFIEPQMRQAYLDMAHQELEKLANEIGGAATSATMLREHYMSVLRAIELAEKDPQAALRAIVRRMKPVEALELLATVSSVDGDLRRIALRLAYIIMRQLKLKLGGPTARRKLITIGGYGRVDVRHAVYSLTRMNFESIARIRRARRGRNVLVLDKSGSMRRYSVYASLAAATLAPSVSRLVVFDAEVNVIGSVERIPLTKLIENILSTQYSGYTNIVAALKEAARGLPPSRLILVSDLRQTVVERETVADVVRSLSMKGWRLYVIAPPTVDRQVLNNIEGYARTYIVSRAEDVGRIALKILR
jgi:rRNA-processing protein FCF1